MSSIGSTSGGKNLGLVGAASQALSDIIEGKDPIEALVNGATDKSNDKSSKGKSGDSASLPERKAAGLRLEGKHRPTAAHARSQCRIRDTRAAEKPQARPPVCCTRKS